MTSGPQIFDRALLRRRRGRAVRLGRATFLHERAAADVADRMATVLRHFPVAADIGGFSAHLHRVLHDSGKVDRVIVAAPVLPAHADKLAVVADEETLPFGDASLDLVVSLLELHAVNDLPGALVQMRRALRPDGLFMAALLGGDTLTELRQSFAIAEAEIDGGVSPRVSPFTDLRDMGALLQRAGFAIPVTDVERVTVRYDMPLALMADLRRMGMTNVLTERRRRPLRRSVLARLMAIYAERFSDSDGRIRATFDMIWMSGWAPHDSQQQPLKPGSARARLADALGTTEQPAGEKTGGS